MIWYKWSIKFASAKINSFGPLIRSDIGLVPAETKQSHVCTLRITTGIFIGLNLILSIAWILTKTFWLTDWLTKVEGSFSKIFFVWFSIYRFDILRWYWLEFNATAANNFIFCFNASFSRNAKIIFFYDLNSFSIFTYDCTTLVYFFIYFILFNICSKFSFVVSFSNMCFSRVEFASPFLCVLLNNAL